MLLELLPLTGSSTAPELLSNNLPWHLSEPSPWPCPGEVIPSVLLQTALAGATVATSSVRGADLGLTFEGVWDADEQCCPAFTRSCCWTFRLLVDTLDEAEN